MAEYVYGLTGIVLESSKTYLVETRLGPLVEELGLSGYRALLAKARGDASGRLERQIVDAITTNETLFFRDIVPFDLLRDKILPEIARRGVRAPGRTSPVRIWSAACSTGQEAYSIAITALEALPPAVARGLRLVGSDISEAAMDAARQAVYSKFEVDRGMPPHLLGKYFAPLGHRWRLRKAVTSLVEFRKVNLMGPLDAMGKFDVIFCRNVAIYFSQGDKARLFARLAGRLNRDGYLLIGSTESLRGVTTDFELKMHGKAAYYQLRS